MQSERKRADSRESVQLRHLMALADAVTDREPADVISRWEVSAEQRGASRTQINAAINIGLERRRAHRVLH